MRSNWEILREALVDAYDAAFELIYINLLWAVFTVLIITLPAAQAGVYYATNRLAHHEPITWRTFFEGFRRYFWLGWRWTLFNGIVLAILVANIIFYGQITSAWARWAQALALGVGFIWLALQTYTFPLLLEQADQRYLVALRNSLVLFVKRLSLSLALVVLLGVVVAISLVFQIPWLIVTAGLSAFLANRVVVELVADERRRIKT